MKFTNLALAVALSCGLVATSTQAQDVLRNTALSTNYYAQDAAAPSPSDLAATDTTSDLTFVGDSSQKSDGNGGKSKGGKGGKGGVCGLFGGDCTADPWRLWPVIGNGWELTGHVASGSTANADNPNSRYNGPVTFNDREGEYMMNQLVMSLGRDVDNGGVGWDWGGRMDLLYGTDYIFTQAVGLETQPDGTNAWNGSKMYGLAMPQAYLDFAYNNLSFRLGHFYTIMGYEGVAATSNFFYSHAYTMQYGEPFTHTGGLFTYQLCDTVAVTGGLVNGWDKFDATTDKLAFLGGTTYTPYHGRYTISSTMIIGEEDGATGMTEERRGYSMVFDYQVSDRVNYVLQHDNFTQEVSPGLTYEWYGINSYLFYEHSDCLSFGIRSEWFRDDDGARLSGTHLRETLTGRSPVNPMMASWAGNYYNVTLGANWKRGSNLTIRPELRFDWSDGTAVQPYDGGTKDSQFTAAVDGVFVF